MSRRVISLLLAAVLLVGTVAVASPIVSAAYDMKASEDIIALIKSFEGFAPFPMGDYGHYSIGYGTSCNPADYPNGISEEEADQLMRKALVNFETSLNYFAKRNKLHFTQQQFDALISFTYNLGPSWMNQDSLLRQAILNGATGNEFLYVFTMWCTAGTGEYKQILNTLVERRLIEANVYIHGVYSDKVPSRHDFVYFNANIMNASNTARIQGYDSVKTAPVMPSPYKAGYRFLGWYTKASGGEWVTILDGTHAGKMLYGHWQKGDGDAKGVAANYERITTMAVNVYDRTTNKIVKQIPAGTTVKITADYMDSDGIKWGKTADGWIKLSPTRATNEIIVEEDENVRVTVTNADGVNVRKGPGTNYPQITRLKKGDVVTITAISQGENYLWGKCSEGWIALKYTDYDSIIEELPPEDETVTATGIIARTNELRIRNRPGTSGTIQVGTYYRGDKVTITLQEKVGNVMWGKTPRGWVSLYYVDLTPVAPETPDVPEQTEPTESAPTEPAPTEPSAPEKPTEPEEKPGDKVIASGVIIDCITLRVRKGPGTNYAHVASIAAGTPVKIYETTGGGKQMWARIDQGWISMNYVELDVEISDPGNGVIGTVYNCSKLNVRSAPGTSNKRVATIPAGTKVQIFEMAVVKGVTWGRTSLGWVSMEYIKLTGETVPEKPEDKPSEEQKPETEKPEENKPETEKPEENKPETEKPESGKTGQTGTVVKASEVKIRAGAGTNYDKVGTAKKGDRVVILETAKVGNALWGRIEKGWIHMYYVQLDGKEVPEGTVIRTVNGSYVNIRAGAGTEYDRVGQYKRGETVLIYEQTTVRGVLWGRTEKGWISMDYVK